MSSHCNIWFNYSISVCPIRKSAAWGLHKRGKILILAERIIKDMNAQLNVCYEALIRTMMREGERGVPHQRKG